MDKNKTQHRPERLLAQKNAGIHLLPFLTKRQAVTGEEVHVTDANCLALYKHFIITGTPDLFPGWCWRPHSEDFYNQFT